MLAEYDECKRNSILQDPLSVGAGLKTISLRIQGTEAAKQELEELGEETENVIHTTAKLQETIKECTAVASNGFKGVDILDNNGNFLSTYEILSRIAEVYQEIVETDKQAGTNRAALLVESLAYAAYIHSNMYSHIYLKPVKPKALRLQYWMK